MLQPGRILGQRYEILRILGEGGMGAVYKAKDRELNRLVALKVIRPELAGSPDILQRFKQEILLASKVTDRNIIRIYDLGDAEGIKFITMEYVEGEDLGSLLHREGKLPVADAIPIMRHVFSGLQCAHRALPSRHTLHSNALPGIRESRGPCQRDRKLSSGIGALRLPSSAVKHEPCASADSTSATAASASRSPTNTDGPHKASGSCTARDSKPILKRSARCSRRSRRRRS